LAARAVAAELGNPAVLCCAQYNGFNAVSSHFLKKSSREVDETKLSDGGLT
jgi:hypothetical protein